MAFRLGDVSFLLPPNESRKGFNKRYQDFRSLHSSIHRIRMVIPQADKFLHRLSTSRDEVRPGEGSPLPLQPSMMLTSQEPQTRRTDCSRSRVGLPGSSCHTARSSDGRRSAARTAPRPSSGRLTTCRPAEARSWTATREIPILLDVDPAVGLTRQTVDLPLQWAARHADC